MLKGEEDDESSEPEQDFKPRSPKLSATPTDVSQLPNEDQTAVDTDAEQRWFAHLY